jgi:methyl-accepting chemotaxis protein
MKSLLANLKIRDRLIMGFTGICLILVVSIGMTIWKVGSNNNITRQMVQLRLPSALDGSELIGKLYGSLAALRGWMLTGNPAFKTERAATWAAIDARTSAIDKLAVGWTDQADKKAWQDVKEILEKFRGAQAQVEAIANSADEQPAMKILVGEAAPRGAEFVTQITAMINDEATQPATAERKKLLLAMADVRGSMGLALASIRAYLLSADVKFKGDFEKFWSVNEKRFADLGTLQSLMTPSQLNAFAKLNEARAAFAPLPNKMFQIRGSDSWNMAQKLLVTEAAPRADRLLDILAGEKAVDGARKGGMIDRQNEMLHGEGATITGNSSMLMVFLWIMLPVGLVVSILVVYFTTRAIASPIVQVTETMNELARGNSEMQIANTERADEIGTMSKALLKLRQAVQDSFELSQMIEDMPINVMKCDLADFKINYMNKSTRTTLKTLEHLLPVKVDNMIGQTIDIFHKHPEHQRGLLRDPKNLPHRASIKVGDERLSLLVSPIVNKSGQYIGPMLTWSVVTEQLQLSENVLNVVKNVSSAAAEMRAAAESMTSTAEETSRQATAVAAASEQAATNVQTVASAAEELSVSVSEITRQVGQSTEVANKANTEAERTNATVQGLAEAAQKIGEVVNLISEIAEQTNLLALNATIEAARAGEAGKGFAVVASEVKNLANQTAKATEDIAAQVNEMQSVTADAVMAIKTIGETIGEINSITDLISTAVSEQGKATTEIAENTQQASTGTQEVNRNISGVTQGAQETGASAQQVLGAADELSKQAEALATQVEAFMNKMKAA